MPITARIDAITGIDIAHRGTVIAPPRSVKIELTAACNYACRFCVRALSDGAGEMYRAMFTRLVGEMREAGVEELGLFYIGESMLCKWLPDAVAEAKAAGFPYVFLTTNGSAATEKNLRACMEAGLDSLKFSLNFASPEQLAEIANADEKNYWRAIQNLKTARKIRDEGNYPCRIYASSIAFTGEQGERMKTLVEHIKPFVDEHYWLPLYGMSGAAKAAGWKPRPGNPGRLDAMREPLPCWAAFTEGHITHDGLLAACCFGAGLKGEFVMADLKQTSFRDGWNSPAFQQLRAAHLARDVRGTVCESCAAGS